MEGTVATDSGAQIRDGVKSLNNLGACSEKLLPYIIADFAQKPPKKDYTSAKKNVISSYQRLDNTNIDNLRQALATGNAFVFGFTVYDSFESDVVAKTGILPMPNLKKEKVLGGHAVCAVGYDDAKKRILIRNSWGADWGLNGYFWMPYAYITNTNLADDFWTINAFKNSTIMGIS